MANLRCNNSMPHRSAAGQTLTPHSEPECLRPPAADMPPHWRWAAMCHVWTAPSWQELSSRLQHWSVQPCVRPLDAVHMTAGHNALRGSGPGQNLAFDNALAHVGCPDRRIDRLCITCCSPSQPSHRAGCRHDLVTSPARRVPCSAHPWPSSPMPFLRSCWPARSQRPSLAAAPAKP